MRLAPFLLALGLAAGNIVVPIAMTGPAQAATPAATEPARVTVVASPTHYGVVKPGEPLEITGTITNVSGQDLDSGTVTVALPDTAVATRTALSTWLAPDANQTRTTSGTTLGTAPIGELAANQFRSFTVTVPADVLPRAGASMTARPLEIRFDVDGETAGVTRSVFVQDSAKKGPSTSLAVVMPLTTPPGTTGILDAETLAALTAPGGQLDRTLRTVLAHPIAVGIDPKILASIRLLGTTAPQSAVEWLTALTTIHGDIFPLSYADADLVLAARAGATLPLDPLGFPIDESLYPTTSQTAEPAPTPTPAPVIEVPTAETILEWPYTIDGLAWPATTVPDTAGLAALADSGYSRALLASSQLTGTGPESPNGVVDTGDGQSMSVTVADETLSRLLRAASTALSDADANAALASLSAQLAIAANEPGNATLVATLGRDITAKGLRLEEALKALESLPWVDQESLHDVLELTEHQTTLVPDDSTDERVVTISSLLEAENDVAAFATVVNEPQRITGPQRLALLALLAQTWVDDPAGWSAATTAHLSGSAEIQNAVNIPEGSMITLLQEKGNLPITIRNDLNLPVTVYVTVQPATGILKVLDGRVKVDVEANSQSKASIPVQSIANGEVTTRVTLTSPTGVPVSTPTLVELNVQAGWETAATVALAVIVVVLFAAGIGRTMLRLRKRKTAASEDDE